MRYAAYAAFFFLAACDYLPDFSTSHAVNPSQLPPLSGREQALLMGADAASAQGNLASAEKDYLSAVGASQGHVEAHLALARLYEKQKQGDRAREILAKALELQPNHPEANYRLGKIELSEGANEAALAHFNAGLKTAPLHLDLLSGSGIAYDLMGRHVEARNAYNKALANNRAADLSAVRTNLGMSYLLSNDAKMAVTILKPEAVKPNASPTTRHDLALAYSALGRDKEARTLLKNDMSDSERIAAVAGLKRYWVERTPAANPLKAAIHTK